MNVKKSLIVALAPALVIAGVGLGQITTTAPREVAGQEQTLAKTNNPSDLARTGDQVYISGGCIRLTADGPKWHENSGHNTIGFDTSVDPVVEADGDLTVRLLNSRPVISLTVVPDETLAVKGVFIGGSGGVGHVTIRMRKTGIDGQLNLANPSHYNQVRGDYSNIWLTVIQAAE
jgi:hypothetical protein